MADNLDNDDLRDAAAEAGISPNELRHALARREPSSLAPSAASLLGPPRRGNTATHVEGPVPGPRPDALAAVRTSIEQQTGRSGHMQGDEEADIVDDRAGVTYRIRTADAGDGGALVRVDVDPGQSSGDRALALAGIGGVTLVLLAVGWLLSTAVLVGGVALGALGALYAMRSISGQARAVRAAHAVAARALGDAEHREIQALPAADHPAALPASDAAPPDGGDVKQPWTK